MSAYAKIICLCITSQAWYKKYSPDTLTPPRGNYSPSLLLRTGMSAHSWRQCFTASASGNLVTNSWRQTQCPPANSTNCICSTLTISISTTSTSTNEFIHRSPFLQRYSPDSKCQRGRSSSDCLGGSQEPGTTVSPPETVTICTAWEQHFTVDYVTGWSCTCLGRQLHPLRLYPSRRVSWA
jgi:hypothetical protein